MKIEKVLGKDTTKHRFIIFEVYEKYGGMNFRNTYYNDDIEQLLLETEEGSNKICEICGVVGSIRGDRSWVLTLCDECHTKTSGGI